MNILLLNQDWLKRELRQLGHHVIAAGVTPLDWDVVLPGAPLSIHDVLRLVGFEPDRIVLYDNSASPWLLDLEQNPVPSLFYSVDVHHHLGWHKELAALFDAALVAQEDYIDTLLEHQHRVTWFPLWASAIPTARPPRDIDVCFRGTLDTELHPGRAAFFEKLRALVPLDCGGGDSASAYVRSRIVVNETVNGDLNFRVFEAMGCGALLVTPRTENGLLKLFKDRVDLVTYERDNAEDAAEKIRYYLEHESERAEIAASGHAEVLALHTPTVRARCLAELLRTLSPAPKPRQFLSSARVHLANVAILRKRQPESVLSYLKEAVRVLKLAGGGPESPVRDLEQMTIMAKTYLDEIGERALASDLTATVRASCPTSEILSLLHVESLLGESQMDTAREIAAEISDKPDELLASVPRLLREIREQILTERVAAQ